MELFLLFGLAQGCLLLLSLGCCHGIQLSGMGGGGGGRGREEVEGGADNSDETKGDSVVSVPSQGVQGTRE